MTVIIHFGLLVFLLYAQLRLTEAKFHFSDDYDQPRSALILTMAGDGIPPYLQASCLSISASASRFDMLIFHEDNDQIMKMPCAPNVRKINVHRNGLARLISEAVCWTRPDNALSPQVTDSK